MKFDNAFTVKAPIEEVWSALLDVERVAPCMPGAEVLERVGDDAYRVAIKVKVGPISMTYRGDVTVAERDDAARTAALNVKAKETRGQGTADAVVRMALTDEAGATNAALETDVQLSGKVAAMGRGVIAGVAERLVRTFADNLAAMLEGKEEPAPAAAPAEPAAAPAPAGDGTGPAGERAAPPHPPAEEESLPLGKIAGSAIAERLPAPAALLAGAAALALVALVVVRLLTRKGT